MHTIIRLCKKATCFLALLALASLLCPHPAEATKKTHAHSSKARRHAAKTTAEQKAKYADIVIDAESGRILHATNADSLRHPASLTKMMTLYLTFQALEAGRLGLNQYLPVSSTAAEQSPSKLGLKAGQRIRVEDAILGLVTESANDSAVVLAEWMGGGSEKTFAKMMTRQAQALGMSRTHFDNASGLPDDGQITTARDMAALGAALFYHFPQYYRYFSRQSFSYNGASHHNHNHLMSRYQGMDGIKTGYIRASGFNLVASARRGDVRLIGVVFGGRSTVSRDNRMAQLLDQGFPRALQERGDTRMASADPDNNDPQGDGADDPGDKRAASTYVTLPPKVAAIFPPRDATGSSARAEAPAPATGNSWGVQIGAYSDAASGQQAIAAIVNMMPQVLGSADPQVTPVTNETATLYRARLMSLDQQTAQSICSWMIKRGQGCLTVGP